MGYYFSERGKNITINSDLVLIIVAVNLVVILLILSFLIIYYKKYKKLKNGTKAKNIVVSVSPANKKKEVCMIKRSDHQLGPRGGELVFLENNGRRFELDDLFRASAEGLGKGSFGNCYKAMMEIGEAVVVKRLTGTSLKGGLRSAEFVRQVRANIAHHKHPCLLPLLAYYYSKDEKLFLYPFAPGGNLYDRLHADRGTGKRVPFPWSSRLAVARGIAKALDHLHRNTTSKSAAPHGNLKSTNVLLDQNDAVLVADYGLTSLVSQPHHMVCYKTPEYQSHKKISKKSDVWSYGCLLIELLTARISAHSAPPGINGVVDLCGWVNRAVREEWTAEIFDPEIVVHRGANQGMLRLMQIGIKCCEKSPEKRPEIWQVLAEVEKVRVAVDSEDEGFGYSSVTDDSFSSVNYR